MLKQTKDPLMDMVWSQKHRPEKLKDIVLPDSLRTVLDKTVEDGEIPNFLFYSNSAGVGKTTVAQALASELDASVLTINGSLDKNIDTLRGEISKFCSAFDPDGRRKLVLIDESDYLNPNSTQPALRHFIEKFSTMASFIFTCNYANKLIPALRSRFVQRSFDFENKDKNSLMMQMLDRACYILDEEEVKYDKKIVAHYVKSNYPDFRSCINALQIAAKSGPIVKVIETQKTEIDKLLTIIKNKKFKEMRSWCAENHTLGMPWLADKIYKNLDNLFEPSAQPLAIAFLADYSYKSGFAVSMEINMAACLSEIFMEC